MTDGKVSGASTSTGVPASTGSAEGTATVQNGETNLGEVSKRLGVSEQALLDANPQIKGNKIQAGQELKLPAKPPGKASSSSAHSGSQVRTFASDAKNRTGEMQLKGRHVQATLHHQVENSSSSQKTGIASPLNGVRLGWINGSEVKITHSLSPPGGHETRMDAIAYARLSGANPTAIVRDHEGRWHAVQTNQNLYGGMDAAADNDLREVQGLAHFDQKQIADIQQKIVQAHKAGDTEEVTRLQKLQATLVFGVKDSEINFIRSSSDRIAGKININSGAPGGGMHGAEKAPNSNFDPTRKGAMEIGLNEISDPKYAPGIIFHENSHEKDYALTQQWVKQYENETGTKFVPGQYGDQAFTKWVNSQAPKRLSRADAELVSDVSANANGSTEARAYVGTFINALKAGNPETAATQLRTYAAGMLSHPAKINRPTGGNVEMDLKRQLETEYRKMPKEMQVQFDRVLTDLAKEHPDAWVSKFNHATALGAR